MYLICALLLKTPAGTDG